MLHIIGHHQDIPTVFLIVHVSILFNDRIFHVSELYNTNSIEYGQNSYM